MNMITFKRMRKIKQVVKKPHGVVKVSNEELCVIFFGDAKNPDKVCRLKIRPYSGVDHQVPAYLFIPVNDIEKELDDHVLVEYTDDIHKNKWNIL